MKYLKYKCERCGAIFSKEIDNNFHENTPLNDLIFIYRDSLEVHLCESSEDIKRMGVAKIIGGTEEIATLFDENTPY